MEENKRNRTSNKPVIILLVVLILAVLGVGGYFIIKDVTKKNDETQQEEKKEEKETETGEKTEGSSTTSTGSSASSSSDSSSNSSNDNGNSSTSTSDSSEPLEAGIYHEATGNNYLVQAQINGQVSGACDISIVPTDGSQGQSATADIEIANKVSLCETNFSLKGLNPGEHKITVVIRAADGRTKTLEEVVELQAAD